MSARAGDARKLLFLIDECVPVDVTRFLRERGHEAEEVLRVLAASTSDTNVMKYGDSRHAIVVTINHKDFAEFTSRVPAGNKARFRRLSRLSLRCKEPRAKARLAQVMDLLEFEYDAAQARPDKRLLVEILENVVRILR